MSPILNRPPILNSTGLELVEEMARQNSYYAMLAEQQRDTVYSDISQIANIVRAGYGPKTFPIGDQIIIPWIDTDENVTYQVPHNIVSHGFGELRSGETVPVMFTQWDLNTPYGVQFSNFQAFYRAVSGLAAGTYHIKFGATWGTAIKDAFWNFTLTQAVPAGGLLSGFESMPDAATGAWRVKSWINGSAAAPIETVVLASGEVGTSLGVMQMYSSTAILNCMQNVGYGSARWSKSAFRQYLNKAGASWFVPNTDSFEIRPNEYAKKGFLSGYSDKVLAATKELKLVTALNTVEGHPTATETTYDRIFLPSLEQMNVTPQLATVEGPYFEYWRRKLGLSGFAATHPTVYDAFKIPAVNNASPQYVRLRSALRGYAYITWYVLSSGYVDYNYASRSYSSLPVVPIS